MTELKPCPFCGENVQIRSLHSEIYGETHVLGHGGLQVVCPLYRGLTWNGPKEEFIELWNRRTSDEKCLQW